MRMADILDKKRNGEMLTRQEIEYFVNGYTKAQIPDYQASALLMAICIRGMTDAETADLTDCMARSGAQMDLSAIDGITADKHSTGGVGDKTTLVVCGCRFKNGKNERARAWAYGRHDRQIGKHPGLSHRPFHGSIF